MLHIIYSTLERANESAYMKSKETGRYWSAVRFDNEGWIISDRYHPQAKEV